MSVDLSMFDDMVRAKDISPLYITFLERYYEEIKENDN